MTRLLWLVFFVILVAGCDDEDRPSAFETTLSIQDAGGIETSTFADGQPITFVMKVRNITDLPQTLTFSSSKTSDFFVYRTAPPEASPLWVWSMGKGFTQGFVNLSWAAGETKEFTVVWDQRLYSFPDPGPLVGPGSYAAQGVVAGYGTSPQTMFNPDPEPSEFRSARAPFTIE